MQFEAARFFRDVDQCRRDQVLSWRELGRKLNVSPSTFSRMSQGRRPDVETFLKLVTWMGTPADAYLQGVDPASTAEQDTMSQMLQMLRSDRSLAPDAAEALEDILRVAYRRFSGPTN